MLERIVHQICSVVRYLLFCFDLSILHHTDSSHYVPKWGTYENLCFRGVLTLKVWMKSAIFTATLLCHGLPTTQNSVFRHTTAPLNSGFSTGQVSATTRTDRQDLPETSSFGSNSLLASWSCRRLDRNSCTSLALFSQPNLLQMMAIILLGGRLKRCPVCDLTLLDPNIIMSSKIILLVEEVGDL